MRAPAPDVYFEFPSDKKETVKNKCISVKAMGTQINRAVVVGMGTLACFAFGMSSSVSQGGEVTWVLRSSQPGPFTFLSIQYTVSYFFIK